MQTTWVSVLKRYIKVFVLTLPLLSKNAYAATVSLDIITTLTGIQSILAHVGPILSAVLFIVAGIFYAVGQLFPASKRANFHATSTDILVGAIIVAVLSVASNGLALASTHLLTNITINSTV